MLSVRPSPGSTDPSVARNRRKTAVRSVGTACDSQPGMRLPPLTAALPCALALLAGCDAGTVVAPGLSASGEPLVDGGPVGDPTGDTISFEEVILPVLQDRCGDCHVDGQDGAPVFLAGPDVYVSVMEHEGLVVPGEPMASTLLTYGSHRGPAWAPSEARLIRDWILEEGGVMDVPVADAGAEPEPEPVGDGGSAGRMTSGVAVSDAGRQEIDLGEVGLAGSVFAFRSQRMGADMEISELAITAGPTGIHIENPRLVIWVSGSPIYDEDRFAGVTIDVPPDGTINLSSGVPVLLSDFPDPGALGIEFAVARTGSGS